MTMADPQDEPTDLPSVAIDGTAAPSSSESPSPTQLEPAISPDGETYVKGSPTAQEANGDDSPSPPTSTGTHEAYSQPSTNHVVKLSGLEHCMARSYIRMCLAFKLPDPCQLSQVVEKLNNFIRKLVDAKPYLSGWVVAVDNPGVRYGLLEVRFSDTDFLEYPGISVKHLSEHDVPLTYDDLCMQHLPPSKIQPDVVSALGESADETRAPVFRVQINVVQGGIIVAFYLHHCVSDGTGMDMLISGSVLNDAYTFHRNLDAGQHDVMGLTLRLDQFAEQQSHFRNELSWSNPNQINTRHLKCRMVHPEDAPVQPPRPPGRGLVFSIPLDKLAELKARLMQHCGDDGYVSRNDTLMALIWHGMTRARAGSLTDRPNVKKSRLNIPVNIRTKLIKHHPESYFGSAVDFGSAEMTLEHLADMSEVSMTNTALAIRKAILSVDEAYIRQAIALATYPNPSYDVRDLQGSNMDRADGADMYITSWEKLTLYDAQCEMGVGKPDWVRKPWSRDPGSCIIYPLKPGEDYVEAVIQMTAEDMGRLLVDQAFMGYVCKWIE
jgi:trichothecene 3-O-acetyltransferase